MQSLAQRDPRFLVGANAIDADPWLLGVENGVVDLRTGILSKDSKERFILKRCPVHFNSDAKADRWIKFIDEITSHTDGLVNGKVKSKLSPQLADYLQRALGYSITGRVNEHVMFIAIGSGANGKNVLLDTVKSVGGDYMETIPPEVLMSTKLENGAEQASPSVRKLAGARCAFSSESRDGQKLDIAVVKRHTGGGSMTARSLHENPVTFEMTHKLWLMTNHTPQIDHIDSATKGRLNMIPFRMKWNRPGETRPDPTLENADKDLMDKLKLEHEGILLWLIHGAIRYHKEGLTAPSEIAVFTQDYIQSQDSFTRWLSECELCSIDDGFTAGDLFFNYGTFCRLEEERRQIDSAAVLGKRLKEQGYKSEKTRDGSRYNLRPKQQTLSVGDGPIILISEERAGEGIPVLANKPVTV
jgi:putative DNA primase/helicase